MKRPTKYEKLYKIEIHFVILWEEEEERQQSENSIEFRMIITKIYAIGDSTKHKIQY